MIPPLPAGLNIDSSLLCTQCCADPCRCGKKPEQVIDMLQSDLDAARMAMRFGSLADPTGARAGTEITALRAKEGE
jgi:hypothetical protein